MKRYVVLSLLMAACLCSSGQQEAGFKVNGGLSKLIVDRDIVNTNSEYYFALSGQAGFFYNLHPGKRSVIGTELLFSQIEGREEMEIVYAGNVSNAPAAYGTSNIDYHISYIAVPVYFGFKMDALTLNIGVQASYALASLGQIRGRAPTNGTTVSFEQSSELGINRFDYGARAGLMFNLSRLFDVEATYYYGANNLSPAFNIGHWNWKIQQLTLGLRYKIIAGPRND